MPFTMADQIPILKRTDSKTVDPRWPWTQEELFNKVVEASLKDQQRTETTKLNKRTAAKDECSGKKEDIQDYNK